MILPTIWWDAYAHSPAANVVYLVISHSVFRHTTEGWEHVADGLTPEDAQVVMMQMIMAEEEAALRGMQRV
jgi:hypothetical protein